MQSHCARGLSYLDKQNGEKMPEFKSKKDHAYEDWQTKERCKIEIKVKGEILEWLPRDLQLIFGDGDGLEKIRRSRFAMAINELLKLKFLWNGQDPQARLRIRRTCVFPLATYVAVRRGHLEKQLYKELTLLK